MTGEGAAPRRGGWPGWPIAGAAFGLGAVIATGQAPWGFWYLALPALAAATALVARAPSARGAAWAGLFAGAGHFGLALFWIVEPFLIDAARHGWMAPFALVLMGFGLALFWAAAAAGAQRLGRGLAARAAAFAVLLTAAEIARGYLFTGFPWAQPGHVWIGTPVDQVAALAGPHALTLLIAGLAALAVAAPRAGTATALAVLAAVWAAGAARLAQPLPVQADAPMLRLVQPNAEQALKWEDALAHAHFDRLLDLTAAAPVAGQPVADLTIWPETAVPYLLDQAPGALREISMAAENRAVVTGIQRTQGWRGWNSMAVLGPEGTVTAIYDKHHLVPFGEYVPFGDLVFRLTGITAFAAQEGYGYTPGTGPAVLDLGPRLGRVLPLICYEAVFASIPRAAPGRADWILQITNDAWFGTLTGPWQHYAQARLRATEQGLPLIRVANTGVTAVVDAHGREVAAMGLGKRGFLDARLPGPLPPTPYARWGEWPVMLVLLAGFAGLLVWRRQPARP